MGFIMVVVLIDMISVGLIIPVLPALVGTFTGSAADQTFWYGAVTLSFAVATFLSAPILGGLSDLFGRRPILLLGFCGLALNLFALGTSRIVTVINVVSLQGRLLGLLSNDQLPDDPASIGRKAKVSDYMAHEVATVPEHESFGALMEFFMTDTETHHVVVVLRHDQPLGMIYRSGMAALSEPLHAEYFDGRSARDLQKHLHGGVLGHRHEGSARGESRQEANSKSPS